MSSVFNFIVSNDDISVRFSCPNHKDRIEQAVKNLFVNDESADKIICRYTALEGDPLFEIDGQKVMGKDIRHKAVFFENTEYPLIVRANKDKDVSDIMMSVNNRLRSGNGKDSTIISDGKELYGSLNFHNQVGMTDFTFTYKVNGNSQTKRMKFFTEVLSYKLDYRSDLKIIISDIENEYALLSMSFLKDTYQSMRTKNGETNDLVWWQIFRGCYEEIISAAKVIIERPKRRLRTVVRYEQVERMADIPVSLENEYLEHKNNPEYLYRTEDMMLSHDTIENRFLKHALNEMCRRFSSVKEHAKIALRLDNHVLIDDELDMMENEMTRLRNNPFFRGVGVFKGFTQDNLVMKQALGYKTIMAKWIELQQAYELEEGMRKLEVKDICDLYEIWCFIKVKNIVQEILLKQDKAIRPQVNGHNIRKDFIPQLIYGGSVSFINQDNIELASVSYNAEIEEETSTKTSAIDGTDSMTTIQRPDIVLRLTKTNDIGMKYTYLFDAKYRIGDKKKNGNDVPPKEAINQMHRYRDAIYYTEQKSDHKYLKKEIIAGSVLFPGRIKIEDLKNNDYYYKKSNLTIGIGAFPLRPHLKDTEDKEYDTEETLREQISEWLKAEDGRLQLFDQSIPQRGLEYRLENDDSIILVGYAKDGNWDLHLKEKIYYVRTEFEKGSLRITPGSDRCKYLLMYNKDKKCIYELNDGFRIVSKEKLLNRGFDVDKDFYIVFDLKSTKEIVSFTGKMGEILKLKKSANPYAKEPYFTTLNQMLEPL